MMYKLFLPLFLFCFSISAAELSPYQLVWNTPGKDWNGTVPLGNGETAVNVWMDETGALQFYINRIDSIDENGQLLKAGAVKIQTSSISAEESLTEFKQVLDIKNGILKITYTKQNNKINIELWVDANRNVIVAEVNTDKESTVSITNEMWRTQPELRAGKLECSDLYNVCPYESDDFRNVFKTPEWDNLETRIEPDTVLTAAKIGNSQIGWYHRNVHSKPYQLTAKIQGTDDFPRQDPLLHRTFGAVIKVNERETASSAKRVDDKQLQSTAAKHVFEIAVNTKHPAAVDEWLKETQQILTEQVPMLTERKAAHIKWWNDFWNRSWLHFTKNDSDKPLTELSDDFILTRAYALQRYVSACAGRGTLAIKFNGSIFTVPPSAGQTYPNNPDYRRWGPGYWWQNTRLPYFSAFAAGDFDVLKPFLNQYLAQLPLAKYRTKKYFGFDGAYFIECAYFWGDTFLETYGWEPWDKRTGNPSVRLQKSGYHKYEWVGGLELCLFMLDYYEYTGDEQFLKEKALPFIKEVLLFFDNFYKTENGKLKMEPAQALETWWDCTAAMPEVAGLYAVIDRISGNACPADKELKSFAGELRAKLPPLPVMQSKDNKTQLAPAEKFANNRNMEVPELYAVFPFRLFAYDKENLDWALETLKHRNHKMSYGWAQDDIFYAYLGQRDDAMNYLLKRAKKKHEASLFPVFWGPNFDWVPDQDHGGILTKGVQSLIMQTEGKKIDLFPALPKGWNVDFKLHAPYQTIVEGKLIDGKISELKVSPKEREKDIRIMLP